MICNHCGAQNPADAAFCMRCGSRLASCCNACGRELPSDAVFCPYCGTAVQSRPQPQTQPYVPPQPQAQPYVPPQTYQPQPQAYAPQAYQPQTYAPQAYYVTPPRPRRTPEQRAAARAKGNRILGIVGNSLAMAAAFIAFLFVFFISCTAQVSGDFPIKLPGDFPSELPTASDLWYYFGTAYEDIEATLLVTDIYPGEFPTGLYLSAVFGTISAALVLVGTAVLFVLTLVRFLRSLLGKTQKSAGGFACATVLTYILGSMLFLLVHYANFSVRASIAMEELPSVGVSLNGATVAGICLSAIFLVGVLTCAVLRGGREQGIREAVLRYALGGGMLALVIPMLCVLFLGCVQLTAPIDTIGGLDLTMGFPMLLSLAGTLSLNYNDTAVPNHIAEDFQTVTITSVAGFALTVVATVCCVLLLVNVYRTITQRRAHTLGFSIATAVSAIAVAVCSIIATNAAYNIVDDILGNIVDDILGNIELSFETVNTNAIIVIVLAVLFLACAIVHAALGRMQPRTAYAPQQPLPYAPQPPMAYAPQQPVAAPAEPVEASAEPVASPAEPDQPNL